MERWRTDEQHPALSRGTLFHSVLEAHYRRIQAFQQEHGIKYYKEIDEAEILAALYAATASLLYEEGTGNQTDEQALVEWIYMGYVQCYDLDPDWEIVAVEYPLDSVLYHLDGSPSYFRLAGTADLIIRDHSAMGGLWLVDHKTCKDLPKQKDFDLEDQTGIYTLLLQRDGWDLRGAIYNHCRTYKLKTREMGWDERFKRSVTVRSKRELETCADEVLQLMEEAYGRRLNIESETKVLDAPRSPNGDTCSWKCNLTEACIAGRKQGPTMTRQFLRDIGFTQRDTKPGPTFNKESES